VSADQLTFYLITFLIIVVIFLFKTFSRKLPNVGLSLVFVFSLLMNHFFGALIYALPWYTGGSGEYTYLGFEQALYGLVSFAAGSLVVGPHVTRHFLKNPRNEIIKPHPKLIIRYFQVGFVTIFLLGPFLAKLPSIRTFVTSAWFLLIIAVCLSCWKAHKEKKPHVLFSYLALSLIFPIFTTVSGGFLQSGIRAVMSIVFFVAAFFKPRLYVVIAIFVSVYLGLSLYQTYYRDRGELRAAIWYKQEPTSKRLDRMFKTLTNFELLDLRNQDQLKRIDDRLNQNEFVGKAVATLMDGHAPFAYGTTFSDAALALVPRFLWPGKPVYAGSSDVVSRYTGMFVNETTTFASGYVMEFYINFGTASVVIGFVLLGVLMRICDFMSAQHLFRGDWQSSALWYLAAFAFTETLDMIPAIVASSAATVIFCIFIHRFLLRSLSGRQVKAEGMT